MTRELQQKEKGFWEEKFRAALRVAEQKLEMKKAAITTHAKLPKLKVTPFKGTSSDWVQYENMFITQVHSRPDSNEEKFGYLLDMVAPKVRKEFLTLTPVPWATKRSGKDYKRNAGKLSLM